MATVSVSRCVALPDSMPVMAVTMAIFWKTAPPTSEPANSDTPMNGA